jgi:hypothetical protein
MVFWFLGQNFNNIILGLPAFSVGVPLRVGLSLLASREKRERSNIPFNP